MKENKNRKTAGPVGPGFVYLPSALLLFGSSTLSLVLERSAYGVGVGVFDLKACGEAAAEVG